MLSRMTPSREQCIMRGRRVPEIVMGDFLNGLTGFLSKSSALMMKDLPRNLPTLDFRKIITDFERGRTHLLHVIAAKLQYLFVLPCCVIGLAHHDAERARQYWRSKIAIMATPLILPQPEHADPAPQPRQPHMPVHMPESPSKTGMVLGGRLGMFRQRRLGMFRQGGWGCLGWPSSGRRRRRQRTSRRLE